MIDNLCFISLRKKSKKKVVFYCIAFWEYLKNDVIKVRHWKLFTDYAKKIPFY